jgi:hypothetical protein
MAAVDHQRERETAELLPLTEATNHSLERSSDPRPSDYENAVIFPCALYLH